MTEVLTLNPPETLSPPAPVHAIPEPKAETMVPLKQESIPQLDQMVDKFINEIVRLDVNTPEFNNKVAALHNMGAEEIRAAANVSNRILEKPMRALNDSIFDDKSPVSQALLELRKQIEDLDPSAQGDLFAPKRLFGIIPFGDSLRDYFLRYESSQKHINTIIVKLFKSQDVLRKDNAALEQEKVNLWQLMQKLQQYIYVGRKLDAALEDHIERLELTNAEKARIIREELLFYVRQKVQDLLTQQAVSIQGYLALDMVRKNNMELIKGVDRASTTTVSALRTAIIVAQALANQRLVLDQINALNTTTGNLIESTSAMMKGQTAEINKQASSATVDLQKLQAAFNNIYATMDMLSEYKLQALTTMQQSIDSLSTEIERSQKYLDRVRQEQVEDILNDVKEGPDLKL
jgi:uncharacterized protein YaaN involved in tellurite resistance